MGLESKYSNTIHETVSHNYTFSLLTIEHI